MKKLLFAITMTLALCSSIFAQSLSGKRITVPKPTYLNGTKDDDWLPLFVQGQLTTNLQNFSDFAVIDRLNQDKAKAEQKLSESASYSEKDQLEVGKLVAANYIVAINIIKKGNSFSIDAKINDAETNTTVGKAYSNSNCSAFALEDGSEINNMAYELLKGLGVAESRIASLKSKADLEKQKAAIDANANIAKGLATELSQGSIVQSLAYYQKAASFNSEAVNRIQTMTTDLSSGNIKGQVLNEIKQRQEWVQIRKDFDEYYPKNAMQIIYSEDINRGKINFGENTVSFNVGYKTRINSECMELYKSLLEAYNNVKKTSDWGKIFTEDKSFYPKGKLQAKLLDKNKKIISLHKVAIEGGENQPYFIFREGKEHKRENGYGWFEFSVSADKLPDDDKFMLEVSWAENDCGYIYSASQWKNILLETNPILTSENGWVLLGNGWKSKKHIEIPNGVSRISKKLFSWNTGLESITIPGSVKEIGTEAFIGCSSLKDVNIMDGVELINSSAFKDCSSIESITIPGSVKEIRTRSFMGCSSLKDVNIMDGVELIYSKAFNDCSSLESITIPGSVKKIGEKPFENCSSLKSATIMDGVETIEKKLFSGCSSLMSMTIPSSVRIIGERAFENCSSLKDITIPCSVKIIGFYAFLGCSKLESLVIEGNSFANGTGVIYKCDSLHSITFKSITPPAGWDSQECLPEIIYVPKESVSAYKKNWPNYRKNIKPMK